MKTYFENKQSPVIQEVAQKVRTGSEERFSRLYKQEDFEIGDKVRVKMSVFQSELRKPTKEGNKNTLLCDSLLRFIKLTR